MNYPSQELKMSVNTFPDELAIRVEAFYRKQGQDTSQLQAENPYSAKFDNQGGRLKRVLLESGDPQLAADCRAAIGGEQHHQSLGYRAAIARGDDPTKFTGALAAEFVAHNPNQALQRQQAAEASILENFDRETEAIRRAREGDAEYDRQSAKAKADAAAREESLQRHRELQARIQARQERDRAMNPTF